jgi:hypothetical protein
MDPIRVYVIGVVANKVATEPLIPSGYVYVINLNVLWSPS